MHSLSHTHTWAAKNSNRLSDGAWLNLFTVSSIRAKVGGMSYTMYVMDFCSQNISLSLGTHAHEGYSTHCVCVSVKSC